MKLQTFATADDGKRITRAEFVIADHPDPAKRTEWLVGQISFDAPVVRNGALLRADALQKARDILDALAAGYERLGEQAHQGYGDPRR